MLLLLVVVIGIVGVVVVIGNGSGVGVSSIGDVCGVVIGVIIGSRSVFVCSGGVVVLDIILFFLNGTDTTSSPTMKTKHAF